MRLLRGLTRSKGHAAVVVSHDPRLRRIADRVLRLEDGRLRDRPRLSDAQLQLVAGGSAPPS